MPKVSLVTLCYNQLENATKPFVESLYKHTNPELFELIVVNNASTDGTFEYLQELKKLYNNLTIINNSENLGYAKGNNQGLEIAKGEYIFLCNNDLLFTPFWLEKSVEAFEKYKNVGLLGVMTNFCGNYDQVVKNAYELTPDNYLNLYSNKLKNADIIYQDKVIFFCVGIRKEVVEKVGYLDENFGSAWFEDDDYSLRCLYNGYKIAIAGNVFIFHNHSQTTAKLGNTQEGKLLFEKNCKYFEDKHAFYINTKKRMLELEKLIKNKWYNSIFSIKNDFYNGREQKCITIFGIKIKYTYKPKG